MIDAPAEMKVPALGFQSNALMAAPILAIEQVKSAYYLRMDAEDKPGVLAEVSEIFAEHGISIEAVLQKEPQEDEAIVHLVLLTQKVLEQNMNIAIAEVQALSSIVAEVVRIRAEHLGR